MGFAEDDLDGALKCQGLILKQRRRERPWPGSFDRLPYAKLKRRQMWNRLKFRLAKIELSIIARSALLKAFTASM